MSEIIQLLPDHLANQIAAGEVIQRPASVVKELLENAIDAGATDIQLIVKDAGKALIQVVDNGCGMSPLDARMSFERHATSKIRKIEDLFAIHTMGFRGEALASIAAVAQVELKSKRENAETGTSLIVEATEVKQQTPVACAKGTNFLVKNLFFNVPARRKFLKSNTSEWKHIVEEFSRIAMAYPQLSFKLSHNNTEQFHLNPGSLKNRITSLLGNRAEKKLIPVEETTDLVKIYGYIGKPETAVKTRGNQFFFVNGRYIRSPYLNHAVASAFEGLIQKDTFPYYVLFFELDPQRVDVNVHPSKQEVKFDDDRMLYSFLQAAVKHALAKFNIAPAIDFSLDPEIQNLEAVRLPASAAQQAKTGSGYLQHSFSKGGKAHLIATQKDRQQWEQQREAFFKVPSAPTPTPLFSTAAAHSELPFDPEKKNDNEFLRWGPYLMTTVKSGFLLLHQYRAQERILYERVKGRMKAGQSPVQQLLFPVALHINPSEASILEEALPFFKEAGYEIHSLGANAYVIQGIPADIPTGGEQAIFEEMLEQIKINPSILRDPSHEAMLVTMVKQMVKSTTDTGFDGPELIDELFSCQQPQYTPGGKPIFSILAKDDLLGLL